MQRRALSTLSKGVAFTRRPLLLQCDRKYCQRLCVCVYVCVWNKTRNLGSVIQVGSELSFIDVF